MGGVEREEARGIGEGMGEGIGEGKECAGERVGRRVAGAVKAGWWWREKSRQRRCSELSEGCMWGGILYGRKSKDDLLALLYCASKEILSPIRPGYYAAAPQHSWLRPSASCFDAIRR